MFLNPIRIKPSHNHKEQPKQKAQNFIFKLIEFMRRKFQKSENGLNKTWIHY